MNAPQREPGRTLGSCPQLVEIPFWIMGLVLAVAGCAEAVDGPVGVAALPGLDVAGASGTVGAGLVVNEVLPTGDEFVELYNAGTSAVALGGFTLAHADEEGEPRSDDRTQLPDLSLAPGAFFVVVGGDDDDGGGEGGCDLAPQPCIFGAVAVSASDGERVLLLGPDGEVVPFDVPADVVEDGRSWGRFPDGAAALAPMRPTPGAANEEP
jgi:hypothetical protein